MNKQVHIYSVDTSAFYNEEEKKIHSKMNKYYLFKKILKNRIIKYDNKLKSKNVKNKIKEHYKLLKNITKYNLRNINKRIKQLKDELLEEFKKTKEQNYIRILDKKNHLINKNIISVFESTLTRLLKIPINDISNDIIIVQTYFFDVLEDIILNGFVCDKEQYVCLTASAGQIRTKKTVFIKESSLKTVEKSLTCGLTINEINKCGGVNINKYLAYLALNNSATDLWGNFDIDKTIVVDDFETNVNGIVDLIDDEIYTIKEKEPMKVPIPHTDGCGMILPKKSKKCIMTRLPWVKGLLVPFKFDTFIRKANKKKPSKNHGIIKDIYGKEHDILKEKIEIIFTKSQFKMWKYYKNKLDDNGDVITYGWDTYKNNFKEYQCQAGTCNEEEDIFGYAKLNYQMLQTLTDITDYELKQICDNTIRNIKNIGSDKKTMLRILGVTKSNNNKNYIQQALEVYPELLNDTYCKEILKQTKKSRVKEARAAKIDIDGKYTFLAPDLYAFCEWLFLNDKNPKGLLKDGEVSCKLYKNNKELDCLRSPHLYREHAIRTNLINKNTEPWFITNAIYTSCHDVISKILMFDVDGDKSLVCGDETFVKVAKRNMEGIVPLYYNMRKAEAQIVDKHSIYSGLKAAYKGGNIGMISNDITKIWNNDNVDLDVIKLLCMENNFTIDYAKTLYKPKRPKKINKMITNYTKHKVPHFFIYAKDKEKRKVEKVNNSVVNKLKEIIPNPKISFKATDLGNFDYKMLMKNKRIKLDEKVIEKYTELDLKKPFMINRIDDDKTGNEVYMYQVIKNKILEVNNDENYVVDVLVKYLYNDKKSRWKTTLWECFGDMIVENIKENIKNKYGENNIQCEICGKRIEETSNSKKYCTNCAKEIEKEKTRKRVKKYRSKHRSVTE
ncbi:hypothetical protein FC977_13660 [Clostridium sporogenes]|nr:hypothetical protein [Clostridium sporogenes]